MNLMEAARPVTTRVHYINEAVRILRNPEFLAHFDHKAFGSVLYICILYKSEYK